VLGEEKAANVFLRADQPEEMILAGGPERLAAFI
jgi:hypothetical protein